MMQPMHDKRLTSRLVGYWQLIKKDQEIPDFLKFNTNALDDIKDYCMVLGVQPSVVPGGNPNYKFEYMGKHIIDIYGRDMTGKYAHSDLKDIPGSSILKKADTLVKPYISITDEGQFVNDKGKIVKYRSCLIPFGKTNHISHIVAGMSWKVFG